MSEKPLARLEAVQAVTEEGQELKFRVVLDKAATKDISFEVTADGYVDVRWGAEPEILFQSRGSSENARAFGRYSVTIRAGESFAELSIPTQNVGFVYGIQMLKMGLGQPSGDAEVVPMKETVCAAVMDKNGFNWDRDKLKDMSVRVVPMDEFESLFQQTLQKYAADRGMRWAQLDQAGQNGLRMDMLTWMRTRAAEQGVVSSWGEIREWDWDEIFSDFLAASSNVMLVPAGVYGDPNTVLACKSFSRDELELFGNALEKEQGVVSRVVTREQFIEQSKQILGEAGDPGKAVFEKLMAVAAELVLNDEMEYSKFDAIYQAGEAKLDEAIMTVMPSWFAFSQQVHWTINANAAQLSDSVKQRIEMEMAELGRKSLADGEVIDAPVTRHARLDILLFVTLKRNKILDAVKAAGAEHFGDVQKLSQVSEFLSGKQLKIFEAVNSRMPDGFKPDSVRDGVCYGLAAEYLAAEVYRKKGGDAFLNRLQQVFGGLDSKKASTSIREQLIRQYRREQGADALADPIVKLFQYQASTRNQDPIFKKEGAQTGFESDTDVNIHDLVTRKLAGDKDKFFLISSDNHAMAVTKRDGVYSFFEPNTGVVRTSDRAAFERLLISYFDGMMRAGYWPSKIGQSADAATFEIESLEAIKGSTEKPNWLQQVEAEQDWVAAELQKRGIETTLSEQAMQRREAGGTEIDAVLAREGYYGRKRQLNVGDFDVRISMQKGCTDADYQLTKSRVRAALKQLKGVPDGLHRRIEVVAGHDIGDQVLVGNDRILISLGGDFFDGKYSLAGLSRADAGKAHVLRQLAVAIQEQADPDGFDGSSVDVKAAAEAFVKGQLLPDSPGITRLLGMGRAQAYLAIVDAVNQLSGGQVDQNLALFRLQQAAGDYLSRWPKDSQAELIRGLYDHAVASAGELSRIENHEKASADPSMKDFIKALSPQLDAHGKLVSLRKNQYFIDGYVDGKLAKVPGYQEGMSLKKLVALFSGGSLSKEQQGTLAREIEYRYYQESMPDLISDSNKLFREAAGSPAGGDFDARARQQLSPQGFLLNLINDANGGRCDPLSKLMLVAQGLAASGDPAAGSRLLQNFYSVVSVINNPQNYSARELANAKAFMSDVRVLHKKNDSDFAVAVRDNWSVENKQPLTLDDVLAKLTPIGADGQPDLSYAPVFLEVDTKFHAMSAWSRTEDGKRIFGFYDPNTGLVEFSSSAKFSEYMHGHFGKDGMNFAKKYNMGLAADGKTPLFECVTSFNTDELGKFKTGPFSPSVLDTLNREIFEPAADKAPVEVDPAKAAQDAKDLVTHVRAHDSNAQIRLFADQLLGGDGLKAASVDAYLRLQAFGKGSDGLLDNIQQANEILRREKLGLATDHELQQIGEQRKRLAASDLDGDSYVNLGGQRDTAGLKSALEGAGLQYYKLSGGEQSLALVCDAANKRYSVYIAGLGEVKGFADLDAMAKFTADYMKDKGGWSLSGLKSEVALIDMDGVMSAEQLAKPLTSEVERLNASGQKVSLGDHSLTLGDLLMMGAKLDGKLVSLDWKLAEMDLNALLRGGRLTLNADAISLPVHSSDTRLALVEKLDALRRLNGDDADTPFLHGSDAGRSETTALMESWSKINRKLADVELSAAHLDILKDAALFEADRQDRMFGPETVRSRFPLNALCKAVSRFSTGLSMAMFPGSAFAIVDGFVKGNDYEAGRELGGMLADGVDMLVDTLAESTKIASVASKFSNALGKISGALGGFLSAPFSIWAAVDTFKSLDGETDAARRTDLIVNGALQIGSAVLSLASGIAGIISVAAAAGSTAAIAASAFGPIGAVVGVAISLATGIYNAVRLTEHLEEAGIGAGDRALAGFISFFGWPIPERITKQATINRTREQLESAAQENFAHYRKLGVDKFVYSHKAVGTKFHSASAARVEASSDFYGASEVESGTARLAGLAMYNRRKKAWDAGVALHKMGILNEDRTEAKKLIGQWYPDEDLEQFTEFVYQLAGSDEPMIESFTGYDAGVKEDPQASGDGVKTTLFALGGGYDIALGDRGRNNVFLMNETATVDFAGADKNDSFEVVGGWLTGKLDGGADKDTLSLQSYYKEDGGKGFDVQLSPIWGTDHGRVLNREHDPYTRKNVHLELRNIENVFGSQRSDIISGNDADNLLIGNGGDDQLSGGAGADQLRGGHGSDLLWGGRGMDSYLFSVDDLIREGELDIIDNSWQNGDGSLSEEQDVLMLDAETLGMRRDGNDLLLSVNAGWQAANRFFGEMRADLNVANGQWDNALMDRLIRKYVEPLRECGETIDTGNLLSELKRLSSLEARQEMRLVEQLREKFRAKNKTCNDVIKVKDYYADAANRHLTLMDSLGNLYLPSDLATGDYVADKDGNVTLDTLQLQSRTGYEVNLYRGDINENPVAGGNENKRTRLFTDDVVNVIGGRHADKIFGDDRDNVLQGGGGNDHLYGEGGDDILVAGVAGDYGVSMSGGNGKDTYLIREGQGRIFIGAQGDGKNTDRIVLSSGFKQVSYSGSVYGDFAVSYSGTDIHINLHGTTDKLEFSFGNDRHLGEMVWHYEDGNQRLKSLDLSRTDLAAYRVDLSLGRYDAIGTSHGWDIGYASASEAVSVLGSRGNDTFVANGHFNYFEGGKGVDTYEIGAGNGGTKLIYNFDADAGEDILKLGDAISLNRVSYQRQGDNLLVLQLNERGELGESKAQILVKDWFKGASYQHMKVQAADGKSHSAADINVLTRYTALLKSSASTTETGADDANVDTLRLVQLTGAMASFGGDAAGEGGSASQDRANALDPELIPPVC